jgi:hypothetical protein
MILPIVLASLLSQPQMIPPSQRGPSRPVDPCLCAAPMVDHIAPVLIPAPTNGDWLTIECWVRYSLCMDEVRRDYMENTRRGVVDCRELVVWIQDALVRRNACEQTYRQCAAAGGVR